MNPVLERFALHMIDRSVFDKPSDFMAAATDKLPLERFWENLRWEIDSMELYLGRFVEHAPIKMALLCGDEVFKTIQQKLSSHYRYGIYDRGAIPDNLLGRFNHRRFKGMPRDIAVLCPDIEDFQVNHLPHLFATLKL